MLPPLRIHLLAHPQSEQGNAVAVALQARFVEPPASGGLRIPVYFTPDRGDGLPPTLSGAEALDLDAAQHSLVVVLADKHMLRTEFEGQGKAWCKFALQLRQRTPLNASPHHYLPVALDKVGFGIDEEIHILPALLDKELGKAAEERRLAGLSFHIAARALQLLEHGKVPATAPQRMKAPVRIFLSHAKADLDSERRDPVRRTAAACDDEDYTIEKWFDARDIAPSQKFAKAIEAGIRDCSIMLAFQTDHYSGRPWCQREVLDAKRLGAHLLVVNALEAGEPRSFPYAGNVPVIRWNHAGKPKVEARRVIDRAVREALRFRHNRALLEGQTQTGDVILAAPPEALTLAESVKPGQATTLLYPDPPLGREELDVLAKLRPEASITTPLTRLAAQPRGNKVKMLCVGISESGDARRYGISDALFSSLSDEIHLYLLLAGFKIAYGGALSGDFAKASNFTLRLFDLVRSHSELAKGVHAPPLKNAILNLAPWPLHLNYGEVEHALFDGGIARFQAGPRPDLPWSDNELFPLKGDKRDLGTTQPRQRYAWARGLSAMREAITHKSQARLVLGGKLTGFSGLVPGVVEEAWLSIQQRQPLYLAGGYGGAARLMCDALRGIHREEFHPGWAEKNISGYVAAMQCQPPGSQAPVTLEQIGQQLAAFANQDLGEVLQNGLGDSDNRKLMAATDAKEIAEWVLQGIRNLPQKRGRKA